MVARWTNRSRLEPVAAMAVVLAGTAACAIDSRNPAEASCAEDEGCAGQAGETAAGVGAGGARSAPAATGGSGTSVTGGAGTLDVNAETSGASGATTGGTPSDGAGGVPVSASAPGASGTGGSGTGGSGTGGSDSGASGTGSMVSSCSANLLLNGGFESGPEPWESFTTGEDPLIYDARVEVYDGVDPHAGAFLGWLGGVPSETNRLSQTVTVPASATALGLQYSLRIQIFEEHPNVDFLRVRLIVAGQSLLSAEFTNGDAGEDWVDLTPPPVAVVTNGVAVTATLELESEIGAGPGTNFFVDDLALVPTCTP